MNTKTKLLTLALGSSLLFVFSCKNGIDTRSGGVSLPGGGASAGNGSSGAAVISASDKPLDVMLRAVHGQLDARSYRARIVNTLPTGSTSTMLFEYAAPDRYHMTTQAKAAGRDTTLEFVVAGKDAFARVNTGAWSRFPGDVSQMIKPLRDPKFIDQLARQGDARLVGPDTLDGQPTLVYSYTATNPLGMNVKSEAKTWVSVSDGLPRKTESESDLSGTKVRSTITYSDYNADIRIEPPIK